MTGLETGARAYPLAITIFCTRTDHCCSLIPE
jgi:hypothetical protein